MAAPSTRIVSLTVTEKGYCHTPQTGELDERIPISFMTSKIPMRHARRRDSSLPRWRAGRPRALAPFTVLSCDNLPANGADGEADPGSLRELAIA